MSEYIDKQAVIDEVNEWYNIYPDSNTVREALSLLKKAIKKISTEDVRPVKRGRWISDGNGYHWVYVCSVCGWKDGYPFNERHNFCPNCGADMRGTQDE
jgi:rubrerythrin